MPMTSETAGVMRGVGTLLPASLIECVLDAPDSCCAFCLLLEDEERERTEMGDEWSGLISACADGVSGAVCNAKVFARAGRSDWMMAVCATSEERGRIASALQVPACKE